MATDTTPATPVELLRLENEDCPGPGWVGLRLSDLVPGRDAPGAGAFRSDDLRFVKRRALIISTGGSEQTIEDGVKGVVIHADGKVVPALELDGESCFVRLRGWADFGRENTRYERFDDGTTRFTPEE